jgi:two-component system sensor histidine kinase YesM
VRIIVVTSPFSLRLGRRLLGSFFVVLVLLVSVSLIALSVSTRVVSREVSRTYTASLESMLAQLETTLTRIELMTNALAADHDLNALNQAPSDQTLVWDYYDLSSRIEFFSLLHGFDTQLAVLLLQRNRLLSSATGFDLLSPDYYAGIAETLAARNGGWMLGRSLLSTGSSDALLEYVRTSGSTPTAGSVIVVSSIPATSLHGFLDGFRVEGAGTAFLLTDAGNLVMPETTLTFDQVELTDAVDSDRDVTETLMTSGPEPLRAIIVRSDAVDLSMGIIFPSGIYMRSIRRVGVFVYLISGVAIVLALFFSIAANRSVLRPVRRLVSSMRQVGEGNMQIRIPVDPDDEFHFVYRQFNAMVTRIGKLVDEVNLEHLRLQEAELKLLQSQINPHFLYNSLNFIYQMAQAEDHENVSRMAHYLGRYFRFATRSGADPVPLREEIENVRSYVEIQRLRYPGKIDFRCQVPEQLLSVTVPRLVLQPVVENAFVHGIDVRERSGAITIGGQRENGTVTLSVWDDGAGMSPEQVSGVNRRLAGQSGVVEHVGLQNIAWRLRLRYGERGGIAVSSCPGEGTTVVITIPADGGPV